MLTTTQKIKGQRLGKWGLPIAGFCLAVVVVSASVQTLQPRVYLPFFGLGVVFACFMLLYFRTGQQRYPALGGACVGALSVVASLLANPGHLHEISLGILGCQLAALLAGFCLSAALVQRRFPRFCRALLPDIPAESRP